MSQDLFIFIFDISETNNINLKFSRFKLNQLFKLLLCRISFSFNIFSFSVGKIKPIFRNSLIQKILSLEQGNTNEHFSENMLSYLNMRVQNVVPFWFHVNKLKTFHILFATYRLYFSFLMIFVIWLESCQVFGVHFYQETANKLIFSSGSMIESFNNNSFRYVCCEKILHPNVINWYSLCPERIVGSFLWTWLSSWSKTVELQNWITISRYFCRREVLTFVNVKEHFKKYFFLQLLLYCLVGWSTTCVKVDSCIQISSDFKWL